MLKSFAVAALCTPAPVGAAFTPTAQNERFNYPGGIADLRWAKTSNEVPVAKFGSHSVPVFDAGDQWRCLVGLSLDTLPGEYIVYVKDTDSDLPAFTLRFGVKQMPYSMVSNVPPSLAFKTSIASLSQLDFSNSVPPSLPLQPPINVFWPPTFGRMFVDQNRPEASHFMQQNCASLDRTTFPNNGVLMVYAPQNGIVSNILPSSLDPVSNQALLTVIIDHGRGLFSCLDGVQDIAADIGDGLVGGALIGRLEQRSLAAVSSLNTRAEAVIFRWQCQLNGAWVNPLILTEIS